MTGVQTCALPISRTCPTCGTGRLGLRGGKYGAFVACSNYPDCKYSRRFGQGDEAAAEVESRAAPAGEMTVVLGPGWPGVLLHEAVGHGLEGDFNRKG